MTNIALVVLDTLRKDAFDEYFDWLHVKQFYQACSSNHWTVSVHTEMFTRRYTSKLGGYAGAETLNCSEQPLAERLSVSESRTPTPTISTL